MTRKTAVKIERTLRGKGVYKPYVSTDPDGRIVIDSYPLTLTIRPGFSSEAGPLHNLTLTDCSLSRIQAEPTVTTSQVFIGQDLLMSAAHLLADFHAPAYERAIAQDTAAGTR